MRTSCGPSCCARLGGITLREIKAALGARGIVVKALSTIADMLHRLDLSHKKTTPAKLAGMSAAPVRSNRRPGHGGSGYAGSGRGACGRGDGATPSRRPG